MKYYDRLVLLWYCLPPDAYLYVRTCVVVLFVVYVFKWLLPFKLGV